MIKGLENSGDESITVYALKCVNKTRNVFLSVEWGFFLHSSV